MYSERPHIVTMPCASVDRCIVIVGGETGVRTGGSISLGAARTSGSNASEKRYERFTFGSSGCQSNPAPTPSGLSHVGVRTAR